MVNVERIDRYGMAKHCRRGRPCKKLSFILKHFILFPAQMCPSEVLKIGLLTVTI